MSYPVPVTGLLACLNKITGTVFVALMLAWAWALASQSKVLGRFFCDGQDAVRQAFLYAGRSYNYMRFTHRRQNFT